MEEPAYYVCYNRLNFLNEQERLPIGIKEKLL
jgi:hypothetical protein